MLPQTPPWIPNGPRLGEYQLNRSIGLQPCFMWQIHHCVHYPRLKEGGASFVRKHGVPLKGQSKDGILGGGKEYGGERAVNSGIRFDWGAGAGGGGNKMDGAEGGLVLISHLRG